MRLRHRYHSGLTKHLMACLYHDLYIRIEPDAEIVRTAATSARTVAPPAENSGPRQNAQPLCVAPLWTVSGAVSDLPGDVEWLRRARRPCGPRQACLCSRPRSLPETRR